jgi:hypothetical protein
MELLLNTPVSDLMQPRISFVLPVHDPAYGGGLIGRAQKFLSGLLELANRYQLPCEVIFVEWNPVPNVPPFRQQLRWPENLGCVVLRFIEVPPEIHKSLPNAEQILIFEYIAKNVGLRRARGKFFLATNPDLFFSPLLMRLLSRANLQASAFYRVDRSDLSAEIPEMPVDDQVAFCRRHVALIHSVYGSYRSGVQGLRVLLKDAYEGNGRWPISEGTPAARMDLELLTPQDGLHRNAAGDFFLMEKSWWFKLRGYPELHTHSHIDAILCWMASSAGLTQSIVPLSYRLYHQRHDRIAHRNFPQTDWRPWYERYLEAVKSKTPLVVNTEDWGYPQLDFPEWIAERCDTLKVPSPRPNELISLVD